MKNEFSFSDEEVDAALCIWEYALSPSNTDHLRKLCTGSFLDWLKGEEGYASAREAAAHLARFCEMSYIYARHYGFDDSFDWEFVPRWCDRIQNAFDDPGELSREVGISYSVWLGKEIAETFLNDIIR